MAKRTPKKMTPDELYAFVKAQTAGYGHEEYQRFMQLMLTDEAYGKSFQLAMGTLADFMSAKLRRAEATNEERNNRIITDWLAGKSWSVMEKKYGKSDDMSLSAIRQVIEREQERLDNNLHSAALRGDQIESRRLMERLKEFAAQKKKRTAMNLPPE